MSFALEKLTKGDDFFENARDAPWTCEGQGQRVYWKGCHKIMEFDAKRQPVKEYDTSDGEGTVNWGMTLYFAGGKVKESS